MLKKADASLFCICVFSLLLVLLLLLCHYIIIIILLKSCFQVLHYYYMLLFVIATLHFHCILRLYYAFHSLLSYSYLLHCVTTQLNTCYPTVTSVRCMEVG